MSAIAVFMHMVFFSHQSIRLDEAQSLFQTNRDLAGMYKTIGGDVHVPLYHTILYFWQLEFGNSIETVRLISLFFFISSIFALYSLAAYVVDKKVALFASLLFTLSPFVNWYASEARMYTMLTFFVSLNLLYFFKLIREGRPMQWLLYTLTAILGIYTHYFFFLVLLTQALFFLRYQAQFSPRHLLPRFLVSAAVVVAAITPWLLFVRQINNAGNTKPSLISPSSQDIFNAYAQYLFGYQSEIINTIILSLWPLLVLFAFYTLQKNRPIPLSIKFFITSAFVPLGIAFLVSVLYQPIFLSRYLIIVLPALLIFISWVVMYYPPRISLIFRSVLVVAMIGFSVLQLASSDTPVKENYREVSDYLAKNATNQDVIIVSPSFTLYPFDYYYAGTTQINTLPVWDRFSPGAGPGFEEAKLPQQSEAANGVARYAYVVFSYDQGYEAKIQQYYDAHWPREEKIVFSPKLSVYKYRLRFDPVVKYSSTLAETAKKDTK